MTDLNKEQRDLYEMFQAAEKSEVGRVIRKMRECTAAIGAITAIINNAPVSVLPNSMSEFSMRRYLWKELEFHHINIGNLLQEYSALKADIGIDAFPDVSLPMFNLPPAEPTAEG